MLPAFAPNAGCTVSAVHKTGFRWVITQERKRVRGLPDYETYEDAEAALFKYDPQCRDAIRRNLYFIHSEFAR